MKVVARLLCLVSCCVFTMTATCESMYYGVRLCKMTALFNCHRVHRGDTWERLFPDERERNIVMRVNRIGIHLESGMHIAIPKNLATADVMDYAPLPANISPPGEKVVIVSISQMAWGAYDPNGTLVRWGPASSARGYCADIQRGCHTVQGHFAIYQKEGEGCFSTKFPVGRGGAPMPYCMFFHGGFALHGSYEMPGYNASHGCVRLFVDDAEWLNEDFTEMGTRVIVQE